MRLTAIKTNKTMKKLTVQLLILAVIAHLCAVPAFSQTKPASKENQQIQKHPKTKIMTLGVYHFAYHNLDKVKTAEKDMISVLDEPYQSQIAAIAKSIEEFRPTIIAIERDPSAQHKVDSLYALYKLGKLPPQKDEIYQLAYRIGKNMGLPKIYCVNDWGHHYGNLSEMFKDSLRLQKFGNFIDSLDKAEGKELLSKKVTNIIEELAELNDPNNIKESLSSYLTGAFLYEESPGDFTGVDFETGRWFNRNLRIVRNIKRIPHTPQDRILVIFGAGHMNLLNPLLDVSREFELISPLPYLPHPHDSK